MSQGTIDVQIAEQPADLKVIGTDEGFDLYDPNTSLPSAGGCFAAGAVVRWFGFIRTDVGASEAYNGNVPLVRLPEGWDPNMDAEGNSNYPILFTPSGGGQPVMLRCYFAAGADRGLWLLHPPADTNVEYEVQLAGLTFVRAI